MTLSPPAASWRSGCARVSLCLGLLALGSTVVRAADSPVANAAKQQRWDEVRALIADHAAVDAPQADGATALHWAAYWNERSVLTLLIDAGADLDAANEYGATPLWAACANRHGDVVERLLEAGADPHRGLDAGETLLMRCAHTGDPAAIRALVRHGADLDATEPEKGQTALMRAVATGHAEITQMLLEAGASLDMRTRAVQQLRGTGERSTTSPQGSTYFDAGGFTALLFAARHGDLASARWLLDAGADVDDAGADGNSAMVLAAMSGHEQLARYLLARGADPSAAGAGYSGLHAAVLRTLPALMRDLLARGADPNLPLVKSTPVPRWTYQHIFTRREKGATPLLLAAKYLEPNMVRVLAEHGGDVLQPMDDGTTPLMAAVGLSANRSTTRRNRLIAPELVSAEWANDPLVRDTVRALLDGGADVSIDAAGPSGNTALHTAARYRFTAAANALLASGAEDDIENEAGTTAREMLDRLETGP
ncbi:MAG TPA: ankyrin repeat domain-containing protein [Acidobacteria bacterium]|nr:ankyrin repeat domain-containing protein [Acidobacteriota bacterium]